MSASKKYELFCSEPMKDKPVTKLPGIGPVLGKRLADCDFTLARHVYQKLKQLKFDEDKFGDWLRDFGASLQHSDDCYDALVDWHRQFAPDPSSSARNTKPQNRAKKKNNPGSSGLNETNKKPNNYLHILHQNIAGLINKNDDLNRELYLLNLKKKIEVDVICITEHNMMLDTETDFHEPGYKLATSFCRSDISKGGACIIVKTGTKYKSLPEIKNISVPEIFECCAIELTQYKIIVVCIYRVPNNKELQIMRKFFEKLEFLLEKLSRRQSNIVIAGDFNIDILTDTGHSRNFEDLLNEFDLRLSIEAPTRFGTHNDTCIDNIAHDFKRNWKAEVVDLGLSDHAAQLLKCPKN